MKILIAEDDPAQAERLAVVFQKTSEQRLEIRVVDNWRDCIRVSHSWQSDVAYVDPGMPLEPGGRVLDWHESAPRVREIFPPVVILTGMPDPEGEMELEFYKYGAQNVFQKVQDIRLIVPHLLSSGASAHLRRVMPQVLAKNGR